MRIKLLYTPSYIRFQPHPPLGIATLASALRKKGFDVDQVDLELKYYEYNMRHIDKSNTIDLRKLTNFKFVNESLFNKFFSQINKNFFNLLFQQVDLNNCDIVGFSIMSLRQFSTALLFAKKIRQEKKDIKIIFGGAFVKGNSQKTIENYEFVDFVLTGQAYQTFPKLIECIRIGDFTHIEDIPGLFYRNKGILVANKYRDGEINKMPIPDFDGLPLSTYIKLMNIRYKKKFNFLILKYLLSRGCSYAKCRFCNRYEFERLDLKSPAKIVEELKLLSKKYKTKLFSLECEMINQSNDWLFEICNRIIKSRFFPKWYAYGRAVDIDKETFKILHDAGNLILRWGVESGSQRILDKMKKGCSIDEIEKILRWSSNAKIWNHVNFILGFPGENEKDVDETIEFIRRNKSIIDSIKINPFYVSLESNIANRPTDYNIAIRDYKIDKIEYSQLDGKSWEMTRKSILIHIKKICEITTKCNISFVGSVFDILFPALCYFGNKDKTKVWLKKTHPYFLKCYHTNVFLQKLYFPERTKKISPEVSWSTSIGRGGGSTDNLEMLEKMVSESEEWK